MRLTNQFDYCVITNIYIIISQVYMHNTLESNKLYAIVI